MATILLVEDNDDIREMMAVALELGGYRVVAAPNGRAALEVLRHTPRPSLILLDLMMPVMNGWEVCKALKGDPSLADIPVVVVSAVTTDVCERLSGTRLVPKPIDLDYLLDVVDEQCGTQFSGPGPRH